LVEQNRKTFVEGGGVESNRAALKVMSELWVPRGIGTERKEKSFMEKGDVLQK